MVIQNKNLRGNLVIEKCLELLNIHLKTSIADNCNNRPLRPNSESGAYTCRERISHGRVPKRRKKPLTFLQLKCLYRPSKITPIVRDNNSTLWKKFGKYFCKNI